MKYFPCRQITALLLALLLTPISALAEGDAPSPEDQGPPSQVKVTDIQITTGSSHPTTIILEPGSSATPLNSEITFEPDRPKDVTPKWTSSDTAVATVAQDNENPKRALVTPVAPGSSTVKVSVMEGNHEIHDECTVLVSGITLSKTSLELFSYNSQSLTWSQFGLAEKVPVVWESSNISVADVDNGRIDAHFPGTATITATAGSYSASCEVTVKEDLAGVVNGELGEGRLCKFSTLVHDLGDRSVEKTGHSLDKVATLSVPSKQGTLYYGYRSPEAPGHGVGSSETYYISPDSDQYGLSDVVFVPNPEFSGTADITYTAYSSDGQAFRGRIHIKVDKNQDLTYQTSQDKPVHFLLEDLQTLCHNQAGRDAEYFIFDVPAPREGSLYRNYTVAGAYAQLVEPDTRLKPKSSPSGELVTFVPAEGFAGTVQIPFLCMDTYGTSFTGRVSVTVLRSGSPSSPDALELTVEQGDELDFSSSTFNSACEAANGHSLRFLRFDSLPDPASGTLFYEYDTSDETPVSIKTAYGAYSYSGYPSLSDLTFVPAPGFEGVVDLPFTGQDSSGAPFLSTLHITVTVPSVQDAKTISYYTDPAGVVRFRTEDFDWVCRAATGQGLDYVKFTPPARDHGYLYYTGDDRSSRVDRDDKFKRNGSRALLNNICFQTGYDPGTVYIKYTGYSTGSKQFRGTVVIYVGAINSAQITYTGSAAPIALRSVDFQVACVSATGSALRSIRFPSLPPAYQGNLSQDRSRISRTDVSYAAGEQLDSLSFIPAAGFQGHVLLPYEGLSTSGSRFSGSLDIAVSNIYCPTSYPDMQAGWEWARPSVEFLKAIGVNGGFEDKTYRPAKSLSRAEYTVMICRAFGFRNTSAPGFSDVPLNSYYAPSVAAARERGIVSGDHGKFRPDDPITRQDAALILFRALEVTDHSIPFVYEGILTRYSDGSQVSSYATRAMATLVQLEIFQGDDLNRLRPKEPINRAEIAVVLHKALTR